MEYDVTAPTPFDDHLQIRHHFGDGLYAKEIHVPAGEVIGKHVHNYTHFSVLAQGTAIVETDGGDGTRKLKTRQVIKPGLIEVKANVYHKITALTDVTWYCIHATERGKP